MGAEARSKYKLDWDEITQKVQQRMELQSFEKMQIYLLDTKFDPDSVLWSLRDMSCEMCEHFTPLVSAFELTRLSILVNSKNIELHQKLAVLATGSTAIRFDIRNTSECCDYLSRFLFTVQRSPESILQMLLKSHNQKQLSRIILQQLFHFCSIKERYLTAVVTTVLQHIALEFPTKLHYSQWPSVLRNTLESVATRTEVSTQFFNRWSVIHTLFENISPEEFDSLSKDRKTNLSRSFKATQRPRAALRLAKTLLQEAFGALEHLKMSILRTVGHLLGKNYPAGVLDHFLLKCVCLDNLKLFLSLEKRNTVPNNVSEDYRSFILLKNECIRTVLMSVGLLLESMRFTKQNLTQKLGRLDEFAAFSQLDTRFPKADVLQALRNAYSELRPLYLRVRHDVSQPPIEKAKWSVEASNIVLMDGESMLLLHRAAISATSGSLEPIESNNVETFIESFRDGKNSLILWHVTHPDTVLEKDEELGSIYYSKFSRETIKSQHQIVKDLHEKIEQAESFADSNQLHTCTKLLMDVELQFDMFVQNLDEINKIVHRTRQLHSNSRSIQAHIDAVSKSDCKMLVKIPYTNPDVVQAIQTPEKRCKRRKKSKVLFESQVLVPEEESPRKKHSSPRSRLKRISLVIHAASMIKLRSQKRDVISEAVEKPLPSEEAVEQKSDQTNSQIIQQEEGRSDECKTTSPRQKFRRAVRATQALEAMKIRHSNDIGIPPPPSSQAVEQEQEHLSPDNPMETTIKPPRSPRQKFRRSVTATQALEAMKVRRSNAIGIPPPPVQEAFEQETNSAVRSPRQKLRSVVRATQAVEALKVRRRTNRDIPPPLVQYEKIINAQEELEQSTTEETIQGAIDQPRSPLQKFRSAVRATQAVEAMKVRRSSDLGIPPPPVQATCTIEEQKQFSKDEPVVRSPLQKFRRAVRVAQAVEAMKIRNTSDLEVPPPPLQATPIIDELEHSTTDETRSPLQKFRSAVRATQAVEAIKVRRSSDLGIPPPPVQAVERETRSPRQKFRRAVRATQAVQAMKVRRSNDLKIPPESVQEETIIKPQEELDQPATEETIQRANDQPRSPLQKFRRAVRAAQAVEAMKVRRSSDLGIPTEEQIHFSVDEVMEKPTDQSRSPLQKFRRAVRATQALEAMKIRRSSDLGIPPSPSSQAVEQEQQRLTPDQSTETTIKPPRSPRQKFRRSVTATQALEAMKVRRSNAIGIPPPPVQETHTIDVVQEQETNSAVRSPRQKFQSAVRATQAVEALRVRRSSDLGIPPPPVQAEKIIKAQEELDQSTTEETMQGAIGQPRSPRQKFRRAVRATQAVEAMKFRRSSDLGIPPPPVQAVEREKDGLEESTETRSPRQKLRSVVRATQAVKALKIRRSSDLGIPPPPIQDTTTIEEVEQLCSSLQAVEALAIRPIYPNDAATPVEIFNPSSAGQKLRKTAKVVRATAVLKEARRTPPPPPPPVPVTSIATGSEKIKDASKGEDSKGSPSQSKTTRTIKNVRKLPPPPPPPLKSQVLKKVDGNDRWEEEKRAEEKLRKDQKQKLSGIMNNGSLSAVKRGIYFYEHLGTDLQPNPRIEIESFGPVNHIKEYEYDSIGGKESLYELLSEIITRGCVEDDSGPLALKGFQKQTPRSFSLSMIMKVLPLKLSRIGCPIRQASSHDCESIVPNVYLVNIQPQLLMARNEDAISIRIEEKGGEPKEYDVFDTAWHHHCAAENEFSQLHAFVNKIGHGYGVKKLGKKTTDVQERTVKVNWDHRAFTWVGRKHKIQTVKFDDLTNVSHGVSKEAKTRYRDVEAAQCVSMEVHKKTPLTWLFSSELEAMRMIVSLRMHCPRLRRRNAVQLPQDHPSSIGNPSDYSYETIGSGKFKSLAELTLLLEKHPLVEIPTDYFPSTTKELVSGTTAPIAVWYKSLPIELLPPKDVQTTFEAADAVGFLPRVSLEWDSASQKVVISVDELGEQTKFKVTDPLWKNHAICRSEGTRVGKMRALLADGYPMFKLEKKDSEKERTVHVDWQVGEMNYSGRKNRGLRKISLRDIEQIERESDNCFTCRSKKEVHVWRVKNETDMLAIVASLRLWKVQKTADDGKGTD